MGKIRTTTTNPLNGDVIKFSKSDIRQQKRVRAWMAVADAYSAK